MKAEYGRELGYRFEYISLLILRVADETGILIGRFSTLPSSHLALGDIPMSPLHLPAFAYRLKLFCNQDLVQACYWTVWLFGSFAIACALSCPLDSPGTFLSTL